MIFDFLEFFTRFFVRVYQRTTRILLAGPQHIWTPDPDPIGSEETQKNQDAQKTQYWDTKLQTTVRQRNQYAQGPNAIEIAPLETAGKRDLSVLASRELRDLKPNNWKDKLFVSICWLGIIASVVFLMRFVMRKLKQKPMVQPQKQEEGLPNEEVHVMQEEQLPLSNVEDETCKTPLMEEKLNAADKNDKSKDQVNQAKANICASELIHEIKQTSEVATEVNVMQEAKSPYNADVDNGKEPIVNVNLSIHQPDADFAMSKPKFVTEVNVMEVTDFKLNDSKKEAELPRVVAADAKEESDSQFLKETFYLPNGAEFSLGCRMLKDDEIGTNTDKE